MTLGTIGMEFGTTIESSIDEHEIPLHFEYWPFEDKECVRLSISQVRRQ